uniref:Short-chain dehydrogenase/reductase SDR n=1 Tax=Polynucleobacter necessarius subsp. necessarius (strain STIR1) TaxID=452638 RepID=B1XTE9_POLNS
MNLSVNEVYKLNEVKPGVLVLSVALIFGASGSIGKAIYQYFHERGSRVIGVGRSNDSNLKAYLMEWIAWTGSESQLNQELGIRLVDKKLDCVVWAQGMNFNDKISSFDSTKHLQMYEANVVFILKSLHAIMGGNFLAQNARLCIISSIWQNIARQEKLSYCVTKSALQGLVQSLTVDLGREGILVNAVLPGALDTPMTRSNLNSAQLENLESATPLKSLANLGDVAGLVHYLCSQDNTGITGQFIAADRGFSNARIL